MGAAAGAPQHCRRRPADSPGGLRPRPADHALPSSACFGERPAHASRAGGAAAGVRCHPGGCVPCSGRPAGRPGLLRPPASVEAEADPVYFSAATLMGVLARGARQALMIALACGALAALALATAAMWLVLSDRLFVLYAAMTGLQAVYLAYFSGQGFRWPWLAAASGLAPMPGTSPSLWSARWPACSRARSRICAIPRRGSIGYSAGWQPGSRRWPWRTRASSSGWDRWWSRSANLMFLGAGVFVLVVAFLAWRRGNRAAGWFLFAWVLLETFAIVTSARLLFTRAVSDEALFYYGLPGSMVASAILTSPRRRGPPAPAASCAHRGRAPREDRPTYRRFEPPFVAGAA